MVNRRTFLHTAAALAGLPGLAADTREIEGIRFCWCAPGRFRMGSPVSEPGHRDDEAQADVTIAQGFWMAAGETTQGQWRRIAGAFPGEGPSAAFGLGDDIPLYWVSYLEAEAFCDALTARARRGSAIEPDQAFRLPTEAQWEYACRAGTTTPFAFGEALTPAHANIGPERPEGDRSRPPDRQATPAGRYAANAWGLYDMHGNLFEWCRDWYHARLPGGVDPDLSDVKGQPNRDGTYSRVRRGGAWNDPSRFCRSAMRLRYEPERRSDHIGFRAALVSVPPRA
jgi:formylglycine-generating enzyme required for sulfatase activity